MFRLESVETLLHHEFSNDTIHDGINVLYSLSNCTIPSATMSSRQSRLVNNKLGEQLAMFVCCCWSYNLLWALNFSSHFTAQSSTELRDVTHKTAEVSVYLRAHWSEYWLIFQSVFVFLGIIGNVITNHRFLITFIAIPYSFFPVSC